MTSQHCRVFTIPFYAWKVVVFPLSENLSDQFHLNQEEALTLSIHVFYMCQNVKSLNWPDDIWGSMPGLLVCVATSEGSRTLLGRLGWRPWRTVRPREISWESASQLFTDINSVTTFVYLNSTWDAFKLPISFVLLLPDLHIPNRPNI